MTKPSRMPGSKISSAPDLFSNENGFAIFMFYARPNGGHGRLTERTIRKEIGKMYPLGFFFDDSDESFPIPGSKVNCIPHEPTKSQP